jgi:hypothetical protein
MNHVNYSFWLMAVGIFTVIYFSMDRVFLGMAKIKISEVTYENAKNSLDRLATWTTWLTGLQTAAIAAMGLLFKQPTSSRHLLDYGFFTLLFFGSSIILATWLLSSLPAIQLGLINSTEANPKNDIYMLQIFTFVPLRMGRFTGLIHTYFLAGIVFFALFIFEIFSN